MTREELISLTIDKYTDLQRMYEDKAEYYKKTGIERRGADKKG